VDSANLNYARCAMKQLIRYFKSIGMPTAGKHKLLIRKFAELNNLIIPNNEGLLDWIVKLYLSRANEFVSQNDPEVFYSSKPWKILRLKVLKHYPKKCMKCGCNESP